VVEEGAVEIDGDEVVLGGHEVSVGWGMLKGERAGVEDDDEECGLVHAG
jgi:hypothetical protein